MQKGASNFLALRNVLLSEQWDEVPKNLTVAKSIESWAKGKFTVKGETIYFDGADLPSAINSRITAMVRNGEDPTPVFNFWERLQKNPSFRSVKQLWGFLEHQNIPLTPEGCFLAYKSVRQDYKDHHSNTFVNTPGSVHEMPRNQISDDPDLACHDGFHVGAVEYARTFGTGGRMVICKVDPEHVVCVPKDASQRKMRVCKYEVIGNYGTDLPSTSFKEESYDHVEDEEDEGEDDDYEDGSEASEPESVGGQETSVAISSSEKRVPKKGFSKLDKLGYSELLEQPLDVLRKYATKALEIVGASKIPGGKTALIARILDVRK